LTPNSTKNVVKNMNQKMVKIKDLLLKLFIPSECEACKWKKQCNVNRNEEECTKICKKTNPKTEK